jgi:hypothetical protein
VSCWKVLKQCLGLKEEIQTFLARKRKPVAEFNYVDEWICEFVVVYVINHMDELNTCFQGKDLLINSAFFHAKAI